MDYSLLKTYINTIYIGIPYESNEIKRKYLASLPFTPTPENTISYFIEENMTDFVMNIDSFARNSERILVVTENEEIKKLYDIFSAKFKKNFPSIMYKGNIDCTRAAAEINRIENTLTDGENEYIITDFLTTNVLKTEDDRIIVKDVNFSSIECSDLIKKRTGELWGKMLPTKYKASEYMGSLSGGIRNIDDAAVVLMEIISQIIEKNRTNLRKAANYSFPSIENTLLFKNNICLVTAWREDIIQKNFNSVFRQLVFSTVFGQNLSDLDKNMVMEVMIENFKGKNLPYYFINFFERTFFNGLERDINLWKDMLSFYIYERSLKNSAEVNI